MGGQELTGVLSIVEPVRSAPRVRSGSLLPSGASLLEPNLHVGDAYPHGARRAIRYGDGWIPGGDIREVLPKFCEMAREAGRDPGGIEIT